MDSPIHLRPPGSPTDRRPPRFALLPAACAALTLLAACGAQADLGSFSYARTTRDLLLTPPEFEHLSARDDAPPEVGALMPSGHFQQDGAAMRSLVMPPPAEVRFQLGDLEGPRTLRLRAGADLSAARRLRNLTERGTLTFEVLQNGVSVFRGERVIERDSDPKRPGTEWLSVGDKAGLSVASGDVITLRTDVLGPDGQRLEPRQGLRVGFGGLRLEERVRRERAGSSPTAPNLVVIVVDTLRRDRLSTYGYERETSPALDTLAARGTVFENAYATSSWTLPSTASLFTGLQVPEHGVRDTSTGYLADELTTLAEVCRDAGLARAGWSGNPLIHRRQNFDQGFSRLTCVPDGFRDTGTFFSGVEQWLGEQGDQRFLLYLHLVEPHHQYRPLPRGAELLAPDVDDTDGRLSDGIVRRVVARAGEGPLDVPIGELVGAAEQRAVSDLYDACVWSADHWLARVVEVLDANGLTDRTLVAFTSDHGEELFDRNHLGHGRSLHGELVRTPLVLAGPGVPAGQRNQAVVSNRALAPYLAGRVGSSELGPDTLFEPAVEPVVLFSTDIGFFGAESGVTYLGMRAGERTVHYALPASGTPTTALDLARLRVFEPASDAGELRDLAAADPDLAAAAWGELRERFERLHLAVGVRPDPIGEDALDLLERIGYMGR